MTISKSSTVVEYEDWYLEMFDPVRQALYLEEQPDVERTLVEARSRMEQLDLPVGTREVVQFVMRWYEFIAALKWQDQSLRDRHYREALEEFSRAAATPEGENQRRRLLVILRCAGWLHRLDDLGRPELDELLDGLTGAGEDEYLWHNIAGWAFAAGESDLLERAYEVMLTHPSNLLGQAKWQRINLMMLLRSGRATRRDVEETIKGMECLPQILEFRQQFWPVCIEQQLVDEELTMELEQAYRRITTAPPVPRLERRTKNIRN